MVHLNARSLLLVVFAMATANFYFLDGFRWDWQLREILV